MQFVTNLRPRTIKTFSNHSVRPAAWLLSTHRLTNATRKFAWQIRDQGLPLFADNGTKQLIEQVIAMYKGDAKVIQDEVRALRRQLKHTPRGKDVPDELRARASRLSHEVVDTCVAISEKIGWEELLENQLSMRPTHLIAQEDFAVACLIALGLERETTGWPVSYFKRRNQRSLRLWQRVAEDPRCRDLNVYAVLSATDYNTARAAGLLAAQFGVTCVALGTAAITLDRSSVDFYVKGYTSYPLEKKASRRYVRLAQLVRGISDGYRDAGVRLKAFHALGLGAASLLPVLAEAADEGTELSIDSTSPVHDAVRDFVMYDPARNGDRVNLSRIVTRIVRGDDWPFTCPFCQSARGKFGHRPEKALTWWKEQGHPVIKLEDLRAGQPVSSALPLFSKQTGAIGTEVRHARIAHNHWVLTDITRTVPNGTGRRQWAQNKIKELIAYEFFTTVRGLRAARQVLDS